MTRGTIVLLGPKLQEAQLLATRLEREGFSVVTHATAAAFGKWLRHNTAQAVLVTQGITQPSFQQGVAAIRNIKTMRHIPIIFVTDDTVAPWVNSAKEVGEVLCLHRISLAEAVRRLRLALELTQVARHIMT